MSEALITARTEFSNSKIGEPSDTSAYTNLKDGNSCNFKIDKALDYIKEQLLSEINFKTEAQVKQYFGEALLFVDDISGALNKYENNWQEINRKDEFPPKITDSFIFGFLRLVSFLISAVWVWYVCKYGIFNNEGNYEVTYPEVYWHVAGVILLGFCFFGLGSLIGLIVAYPFHQMSLVAHDMRVSRKTYTNPDWFLIARKKISVILSTLETAEAEAINKITRERSIETMRAEYEIKDEFGKRSTDDKIRIIREELEAAIRLSENHEEQHKRTEEIRVKYAKEMTAIQKEAIQDNNKDLFDKLQVVQSIFGGQ